MESLTISFYTFAKPGTRIDSRSCKLQESNVIRGHNRFNHYIETRARTSQDWIRTYDWHSDELATLASTIPLFTTNTGTTTSQPS